MIRSVEIPAGNTRMGCAPGGDCCDSCKSHKPAAPAGVRNMALKARMGETQCDRDGNCYIDGELVSAPLTTGRGCPVGVPECGGGISSAALYIGGAVLFLLLLEATSRKR